MPLASGTCLGPYEILVAIGAGGMGEVYKARDKRLNREVALKILPAEVALDGGRKRRFEQEARAASALNHPNIVSIHDVGVEGDTSFIVTELVDGESLRNVIQKATVPIRKLVDLAAQMADGLAAAHSAGIVHRDLKPENVMLTRDGRVKILDFGLAKTVLPATAQTELTQSIVSTTEPGIVLGTVPYLSPEQARGSLDLDGRSDQFSFGLILYELVTGKKPFDRPSAAETMAAIIREEPPPLPATVPIPFRWTIERCLAKETSQRYDTTHDLFLELQHLRDHVTEISTGTQIAIAETGVELKRQGTPAWIWPALMVLALAGGVYIGARVLKTSPPSFERLTYRRGDVSDARFSPDGQTVVFSAQWANEPMTIFSMRSGRRESRSLGLAEGRVLSISSSGEMAILLGTSPPGKPGTLARVPLSGGAPREVLENVVDADWSPDGTQLAVSHTVGSQNRIEYPIGAVLYQNEGRAPMRLRISPRGNLLAFFEFDNAIADYAVTVLDLHGTKRVLSRGWRANGGLAWSPKGDEIWFGGVKAGTNSALYGVTLHNEERTVLSVPTMLALDDVARDGRILAVTADSRMGITFLSPGAQEERDLSWFDASYIYDVSSDATTILFVELSYGEPRNVAIYLRKTDGSPAVRLGDGNRPALSPDGKWVMCIRSEGPLTNLMLLPTGAGEARSVGTEGIHYERVEWFPDGQRILFTGNELNHLPRTFVQDLRVGKPTPITPEGTTASRVSPDQKYLTIATGDKLSLLPIAGGQPKPIAGLEPGESVVRWSGDGRYLFLSKFEEPSFLKILRLDVSSGRKELWKELKTPDPVGVAISKVVMTPAGESYAYSFQRDIASLYLAKGLK